MKKTTILAVVMLIALTPLALANVCNDVNSEEYLKATGSKIVRGTGNMLFSWVELFRQPSINENKWEGVGRGVLHTGVRAVAGAAEVATAIIPGVNIPQPDPSCPTDLVNDGNQQATVPA